MNAPTRILRPQHGARVFRPTLRLRLTVLYGGLLVLAAALLLCSAYFLVWRALAQLPRFSNNIFAVNESNGKIYRAQDVQNLIAQHTLDRLLVGGCVVFVVIALVGIWLGYLLAGRALRPIHEVTATARRLSTETLNERIALHGPDDELKELSDTFDGMLVRLEAAFDSQRRFVANASHELRTPLSVMRTEVDVTLDDPEASTAELRHMGVVVRDATDRANRLVDALLVLARTESQVRDGLDVREPVDLPAVVNRALDAVRREVAAHGLRLDVALAPSVVVGDPGLLERLAGNLIENAVRHNAPDGWIAVRTAGTDHEVRLVVANSGPQLDPVEVDGLFEPFRRSGTARTSNRGAGLGLSIVRSVVTAHGGTVSARALAEGGLEVVARLPVRTQNRSIDPVLPSAVRVGG